MEIFYWDLSLSVHRIVPNTQSYVFVNIVIYFVDSLLEMCLNCSINICLLGRMLLIKFKRWIWPSILVTTYWILNNNVCEDRSHKERFPNGINFFNFNYYFISYIILLSVLQFIAKQTTIPLSTKIAFLVKNQN